MMLAVPVAVLPDDAEATGVSGSMSGTEFLEKAVNGVITLDGDVTLSYSAVIQMNTTLIIDLAGHKIANVSGGDFHTIINWGTVTFRDSGTGGTVDNVYHARAALYNAYGGVAYLYDGTFTRSAEDSTAGSNSWYVIMNHGTMTIDGATVISSSTYSSMIANGYQGDEDKIEGETVYTGTSKIVIESGTFIGGLYNVKNDSCGELTINGGTFTNDKVNCVLNWHKTVINGGTYVTEASDSEVLYNCYYVNENAVAELTVNGGTFTGPCALKMYTNTAGDTGTVDINDGTFDGVMTMTDGLTVYGGSFTQDVSAYVSSDVDVKWVDGVMYVGDSIPDDPVIIIPDDNRVVITPTTNESSSDDSTKVVACAAAAAAAALMAAFAIFLYKKD